MAIIVIILHISLPDASSQACNASYKSRAQSRNDFHDEVVASKVHDYISMDQLRPMKQVCRINEKELKWKKLNPILIEMILAAHLTSCDQMSISWLFPSYPYSHATRLISPPTHAQALCHTFRASQSQGTTSVELP